MCVFVCVGVFTKHWATFPDEILCCRIILMKMSYFPPSLSFSQSICQSDQPFSDKQLANRPCSSSPAFIQISSPWHYDGHSQVMFVTLYSQEDRNYHECSCLSLLIKKRIKNDLKKCKMNPNNLSHIHKGTDECSKRLFYLMKSSVSVIFVFYFIPFLSL